MREIATAAPLAYPREILISRFRATDRQRARGRGQIVNRRPSGKIAGRVSGACADSRMRIVALVARRRLAAVAGRPREIGDITPSSAAAEAQVAAGKSKCTRLRA